MSMCITTPEVKEPSAEILNENTGMLSYRCEIALRNIEFSEVYVRVYEISSTCNCSIPVSDGKILWYAYREFKSKDESITYCVLEVIDLNCTSSYAFQVKYSDENLVKHILITWEFVVEDEINIIVSE